MNLKMKTHGMGLMAGIFINFKITGSLYVVLMRYLIFKKLLYLSKLIPQYDYGRFYVAKFNKLFLFNK